MSACSVFITLVAVLCLSCSAARPLELSGDPSTPSSDPVGGVTPVGPGAGRGSTSGALAHFLGRFDLRDPSAPRCAWTGCGLSTRIDGTALDLVVGGAPDIVFEVTVDGVPTTTITSTPSASTFRIADGLAPGEHDVAVFRRSEALFGDTELPGFVPARGSELVATPEPRSHHLEVLGDSISAGYGNEGCPFSPSTENGYLTYAAIAARAVDADLHLEARSGIGMYRSGPGSDPATLPEVYPLTLLDDPTASWLFSSWTPDVIVINLGTNDFALGDPGEPFVTTYVAFVRGLRARYPAALILCATNGRPTIALRVAQVVAAVADPEVASLDFSVPDWSGCDGHPSVAAQQAMAQQLVDRLHVDLGW
jgi:hypothetical protein